MTPEQAIINLENLTNIALQRGLFTNPTDVQAIVESINALRPKNNIIEGTFGNQMPGYVTTSTDKLKVPSLNHTEEQKTV